jgi:hypothetical protein
MCSHQVLRGFPQDVPNGTTLSSHMLSPKLKFHTNTHKLQIIKVGQREEPLCFFLLWGSTQCLEMFLGDGPIKMATSKEKRNKTFSALPK